MPRSCIANLVSRGLIPLSSPLVDAAHPVDERAETALRAADRVLGPDVGLIRDVTVFDQEPAPGQLPGLRCALDGLRRFWEERRR